MTMPGFTADLCIQPTRTVTRFVKGHAHSDPDEIVLQGCNTDALLVCSFWTQSCFWGGCWAARLFGGSGACTTCMTGCLWVVNPALAPVCVPCVEPGTGGCTNPAMACHNSICR
jgi:hypothetical protein